MSKSKTFLVAVATAMTVAGGLATDVWAAAGNNASSCAQTAGTPRSRDSGNNPAQNCQTGNGANASPSTK